MLKNKQIVMENFLIDSEKLTEICRYFGLNLANFAAKNELKTQELYAISGGKQKEFSRQTLVGIAKHCPELSLYWLITGEGRVTSLFWVSYNKRTPLRQAGSAVLRSQALQRGRTS